MHLPLSTTDLLLILAAMAVSALCSGLEIAFVSSNKLYIELQRKQGAIWARMVAGLLRRPARVIGALLLGNTVALIVYGILMARVLDPWLRVIHPGELFVLVSSTVLSTLLILVVSEFLPKALFRLDPNGILAAFALPLRVLYALFWAPMMVFTGLSELLLRLFGIRQKPGQTAFGRIDLDEFLREVSDSTPADKDLDAEVEYFRNTLALSETKVRDRMIPRAEIEAIDVESSAQELHRRFVDTGLSKLLVYKDSIDNIIGYVHGYEMFRRPRSIRAILRTVNFIPGTMPADEALQLFTKQRTHVAVVVDEFGGTAGMLTIEDVVETIVGDIEDEHDEGELVDERLGPSEFVLSARLEVAHLAEAYGLVFQDAEEVDTLAGYILHHTAGLPAQGQVLEIGPFRITIAQVNRGRIDLVNLVVTDPGQGFAK